MSVSHIFIVDYENSCHDFVANTAVSVDSGVLVMVVVPKFSDVLRAKLHPSVLICGMQTGVRVVRSYSDKPQCCDNTLNQVAYSLVRSCSANNKGQPATVDLYKVDPRILPVNRCDIAFVHLLREADEISLAPEVQLHIVAGTDKRYPSMAEDLVGINSTFDQPRFKSIDLIDGSRQSLCKYLMTLPDFSFRVCSYYQTCHAGFQSQDDFVNHFADYHPKCEACNTHCDDATMLDTHDRRQCSECDGLVCRETESEHMERCELSSQSDDESQVADFATEFSQWQSAFAPAIACPVSGCTARMRLKSEVGLHMQREHPDSCYSCVNCGHASPSIKSAKKHRNKCSNGSYGLIRRRQL